MAASAPWWPMVAPPLPTAYDFEFNTCEHGYAKEDCLWVAFMNERGYSRVHKPEPFRITPVKDPLTWLARNFHQNTL